MVIFLRAFDIFGLVVRDSDYKSRGPEFDSQHYQIFWEVVGLKRDPLSLVSTVVELVVRKSSGSGLEIREYGRRDPLRWPFDTPSPQKFALSSLTSGGRSVGVFRSRTVAMGFINFVFAFDTNVTSAYFYKKVLSVIFPAFH
jgi:hypothetical protein